MRPDTARRDANLKELRGALPSWTPALQAEFAKALVFELSGRVSVTDWRLACRRAALVASVEQIPVVGAADDDVWRCEHGHPKADRPGCEHPEAPDCRICPAALCNPSCPGWAP